MSISSYASDGTPLRSVTYYDGFGRVTERRSTGLRGRPRHRKHLLFIHRPTCEDTLPRGRGLCHHRLHLRPRNRPAPLPPRHHRHRLRGILGACRLLLLRRPRQRVRRDTRQLRRDGLLHPRPPRAAAHRQPPCVLAAALLRRRSRAHRYTAGA